ncbi:CCA tRNA nucleotidyltransferase [Oculatella sp. LEGE 06141]|nr:CCA tRNA nucleotidyltransferase [Oculatella sp. LEGE 06141]
MLPPATYLVGGSVRDALLERHADYLDLDFVLPTGAVKVAKAIANHYQVGFVLLDAERQIARVVFEKATVDFAQQVGPSLEIDLQRRDFTVNAIAYNPHTAQLLDPMQGYADLQKRLIRMIASENLKEDPLRLLRAYRQAAQLGFTLEPDTCDTIQHLAPLLQQVAAERVQAEVGYLLSTPQGTALLARAWRDGLFKHWLPHITPTGLEQVEQIDQAAIALQHSCSGFALELCGWLRDQQKMSLAGRSWLKVAKLTCLIAPDAALAEQELWQLKYSRAEVQAVLTVLRFLPQVQSTQLANLSLREQYYLFRGVGAVFPAIAVLAVAAGTPIAAIAPLIARFLNPDDPVAHPNPLLTGHDLMTTLQISAGPQIGQLLEALQLAHAEGKIANRSEALVLAQQMLTAND